MYVDDSGTPTFSSRTGQYYVLSGIIIHESHLKHIENKVREYKIPNFEGKYTDDEVHVYDIANRMGHFSGINNPAKTLLLRNLYNTINQMPLTIISVGIDKNALPNHFPNWETVNSAWTFIAERFDKHISEHNNKSSYKSDKGIIIVDKSSRSIHKEVTEIINRLRQFGSNTQQIDNIVDEPMFISSAVSEQIQIADASAYCTMKHLNNAPIFTGYWNIIYSKLRRGQNGNPIGYGLKIFP
jgi:hypothetical protein